MFIYSSFSLKMRKRKKTNNNQLYLINPFMPLRRNIPVQNRKQRVSTSSLIGIQQLGIKIPWFKDFLPPSLLKGELLLHNILSAWNTFCIAMMLFSHLFEEEAANGTSHLAIIRKEGTLSKETRNLPSIILPFWRLKMLKAGTDRY